MDALELRQAHGRLAAQHGRLEHLAQALLRAAAALLPVRVREAERDRLARRAGGAGDRRARAAAGAAPPLDRRGADPLRGLQRGGAARDRGRRRLARRRHRPVLDPGLGEPGVGPAGQRDGRRRRPDQSRSARPRLLGEVVPRQLGLRDARADPALVLLDLVHGRDADGPFAVPERAHLREAARRARARDAPLVGKRDPRRRGLRQHGRRRDALAVLRAEPEPEPALRLRPGERGQAPDPDPLALGLVLRHLRERRGVPAALGGRGNRARRRGAPAARPLGARACAGARRRVRGRLRGVLDAAGGPRGRGLRRRPLELVHPPLALALLERRRDSAAHALGRARPGAARDGAADAVPLRPPLAQPRGRRRAGLGPPCGLAGAGRGAPGRGAGRRDGRGAARRHARAPGAGTVRDQAAPTAAPPGRPGAPTAPRATPTRSQTS